MTPSDFKVGQSVVVNWSGYNKSRTTEETITKIGHKWVELAEGRYRFDPRNMFLDGKGYTSLGKVYLSHAELNDEREYSRLWNDIRRAVRDVYIPPAHLTLEQLQQLAKLLEAPEKK